MSRFVLPILALLTCAAALAPPSPIEREFEGEDQVAALASKRIMRIESSRAAGEGRRFRFFYLRAGVLEAFTEYEWSAPPGSLRFRRSRERRIEFADGKATRGAGSLGAGEAARLVRDARQFHRVVLEKRERMEARR